MTPQHPQPTPLGRRMKEQRQARGWSQFDMAERANIGTGMVSQLETGQRGRRVGRDIVLKIAKAFNEPEEWWLDLAGMGHDGEVADYRPTFAEFVEGDPLLTSEQKHALITSYISFTSRRNRRRSQVEQANELRDGART